MHGEMVTGLWEMHVVVTGQLVDSEGGAKVVPFFVICSFTVLSFTRVSLPVLFIPPRRAVAIHTCHVRLLM